MPRHVIRTQLRAHNPGKLLDLKQEWGVSMQALMERGIAGRWDGCCRTYGHKKTPGRGSGGSREDPLWLHVREREVGREVVDDGAPGGCGLEPGQEGDIIVLT